MSNKIHGIIRKLCQNSTVIRENFVKNKKTYNIIKLRRPHSFINNIKYKDYVKN